MQEGGATRSAVRGRTLLGRALPAPGWRPHWRAADLGRTLRDCLESDLAERAGFQWLAVAFGAGALVYFTLPREPLLAALTGASLVALLIATVSYTRGTPWRVAAIAGACLAGMTAAKLRVDGLAGPHIEKAVSVQISGRVVDRETRSERRPRIVLSDLRSERLAPERMPERVRVTLSEKHGLPPLGARITFRARLTPVAGPVVPGGYDPRRAAFFEGIGGSGFMLGGWTIEQPPPRFAPDLAVARIRAAIVARIMAAEPGEAGAVAAALLVGERSALSEETNESLRISGLAHILSISGLHMMLIAGVTFWLARALLALSPRLALARPIRKWAALAALLVVSLYLALSGGGVATVRAYVMAVVMFAAILLDRPAISMRNLALAAFIVLAMEPESVVEPGFQMSFAAVAALIAAWELWHDRERRRLVDDDAIPGWRVARFFGRALFGVGATTLVAGFATAPFAAYHFERVASYSLLGNLLAAPLVSTIIMPFGLLTLVAVPLGLEALPLWLMALGIDMLLLVSDWVAHLPGAEARAPRMPPSSLLAVSVGMLWLCLWRTRWRLLGLPAMLLGLVLVALPGAPPDILVSGDGKAVAVRDGGGTLRVSGARPGSYLVEQIFDEEPAPPTDPTALRVGVRCDALACILTGAGGVEVSHVSDPAAFAEDCRRADVIATALAAPADCRAALVIDSAALQRFGSHAIRVGEAGSAFVIETERSAFPRAWQARAVAEAEDAFSISAGER
jgi:competence protein ComEC